MSIALKITSIILLLLSVAACSSVGRSSEDLKAVFALRAEAEALYQQGDFEGALKVYQALSEQVPEHAHTWFRIGNCQAQMDNLMFAIEAYQTALVLEPQFSRAWLNLAYVQAQQLADTAIAMYEVVPAGDPETQRIYTLVQEVLAPFGDVIDALPALQEEDADAGAEVDSTEQPHAQPVDTIEPVKATVTDVDSDYETAE